MVECSHLPVAVLLTDSDISGVKPELWSCTVCRSKKSPWICLACGLVHCGRCRNEYHLSVKNVLGNYVMKIRYVNGHSKHHAQMCSGHLLCMDQSLSVFCYEDDEFVVNDNQVIRQLRAHIEKRLEDPTQRDSPISEEDRSPPSKMQKLRGLPVRTSGLANLGNTCFMNSILQALNNLEEFSLYFKKLPPLFDSADFKQVRSYHTRHNGGITDVSLVNEMRKVSCALWDEGAATHSPDSFFSVLWRLVPRFRGYQQQDAHEFLRYLLDKLHIELVDKKSPWSFSHLRSPPPTTTTTTTTTSSSSISSSPSSSSVISKLFGGSLQSDVTCMTCKTRSQKLDPILDLSLDIPKELRKSDEECALKDCLQSFTEQEVLQDSEWYLCAACKSKRPSTKQLSLHTLPNILCIHLKRFHFTSFSRRKLSTKVHFPLDHLDMAPYLSTSSAGKGCGSILYDLASIVVHHGSGVTCGHYTAYIFSPQSGSWYHFNDNTVTECDSDQVLRQQAYLLFYVRRSRTQKNYSSSPTK